MTAVCAAFAALQGGCYVDLAAGGGVAGGGVKGGGYTIGVNAGLTMNKGPARGALGTGYGAHHVAASDGAFSAQTAELNGRGQLMAGESPLKAAVDAEITGSFVGNLHFTPKGTSDVYDGKGTLVSGFLGFGGNLGRVDQTSLLFTAGPRVLVFSNDFVGDATMVGGEARVGLWVSDLGELNTAGWNVDPNLKVYKGPKQEEPWEREQREKEQRERQEQRKREDERRYHPERAP